MSQKYQPAKWFRWALFTAAVLLLAGAALLEWSIRRAPVPPALSLRPPATPVLEDIRGRRFAAPAADFARDARPAGLKEFGKWLPVATVAVEDHRFYSHGGIDYYSVLGAVLRNVRNGRVISGASTITQQTVKLATGREQRTFGIKWREALSAIRFEREWGKAKILEAYLNRLDYGNRRIGPVAASHAYFGKAPSELTFSEAVFLAGLPQSPSRLNPWRNPEKALLRYRRNVQRLDRQGLLPDGITAASLLASPPVVGRHDLPASAPHFARAAIGRAGATDVRTTLDLDLQETVDRLVEAHRRTIAPLGATACAVVVIDNASGAVRAMSSSARAEQADINAADVPRSAGSTLKPFLYLTAIERRVCTAASLLPDTEDAIRGAYADYDPQNFNRRSLGPVRLREALGNSLNVPAVVTLSRLGARGTFGELERWGFGFRGGFDAYGAGFVLGNAEVTLLDLAGAYASLARGGEAWKATLFIGEGVEPRRMASPEACAILADILCDNEARRISFGTSSVLNVGARVAVKTGTSSGFRDGWCAGFTREHTVAVWAGNLDGSPMVSALAIRSAAPLWASIISQLLAAGDRPLEELRESDRLKSCLVAKETGLIPRAGEPAVHEWFLAGTSPEAPAADLYKSRDGKEKLVLPAEYAAWCAGPQNRFGAVANPQGFSILSPRDGATFVLNPNLPLNQQELPLKSSVPDCEWYMNGERLPHPKLRLQPGRWTLSARSHGREQSATVTVE